MNPDEPITPEMRERADAVAPDSDSPDRGGNMNRDHLFSPDWVSAPGETVADLLGERGLSSSDFAKLMGHTHQKIKDLIAGTDEITIPIAAKLATVLGASSEFWLEREVKYREGVARLQRKAEDPRPR